MSCDKSTTERIVAKYKDIIFGFISRRVSAENFETTYLKLFKTDQDQVPSDEFKVLELQTVS